MAPKRKKKFRLTIWSCLALAWLGAFYVGVIPLAAWTYGATWPTHHQIDMVRFWLIGLILAPLLPFVPGLLLNKWREDRRLRNEIRWAPFAHRLADPDHEHRLDKSRPPVD